MHKKIKITQIRSAIDERYDQKRTLKALGIRRRGKSVIHNDTPTIRGMIEKVKHLVRVEEL